MMMVVRNVNKHWIGYIIQVERASIRKLHIIGI